MLIRKNSKISQAHKELNYCLYPRGTKQAHWRVSGIRYRCWDPKFCYVCHASVLLYNVEKIILEISRKKVCHVIRNFNLVTLFQIYKKNQEIFCGVLEHWQRRSTERSSMTRNGEIQGLSDFIRLLHNFGTGEWIYISWSHFSLHDFRQNCVQLSLIYLFLFTLGLKSDGGVDESSDVLGSYTASLVIWLLVLSAW